MLNFSLRFVHFLQYTLNQDHPPATLTAEVATSSRQKLPAHRANMPTDNNRVQGTTKRTSRPDGSAYLQVRTNSATYTRPSVQAV